MSEPIDSGAEERDTESRLIRAAEDQIDKLIRANRWHRVVFGVMAVVLLVLGFLYWNQHQDVRDNCIAGNQYRAAQTQIWDELFTLSYEQAPPNKNSHVYQVQQDFLGYVHKTNAPRSC